METVILEEKWFKLLTPTHQKKKKQQKNQIREIYTKMILWLLGNKSNERKWEELNEEKREY